MNIALVYPDISIRERYGADIGEIGGRQAPLGVLYLSSFLKKKSHNVIVIDAAAENLDNNEIIRRIIKHDAKLVGISSTSVALQNSKILAKNLKSELNVRTVIGGPHISSNPDDISKLNEFDFGIIGEGELSLANLAEKIQENSNDFSEVPNLIWRRGEEVVRNERIQYIENLDILPFPDRDALTDIELYRPPIGCYLREPVVSIITSRGCPYQCIFCDKSVFGNKIRFFSSEYVISEIEMIIRKYKARELAFVDDTFPCNRKRFIEILESIIRKNFKIRWSCMSNANDLNEDIIMLMKKAGCWQIAIGIESGDDEILKKIKKKTNTEQIRRIVTFAHKLNIFVKGFFMIGHPGEDMKSIEKTKKFALSIPLTDITYTIATPIKGSEFYNMAISGKFGYFENVKPSELNYWKPIFIPKNLNKEILLKKQKEFFKDFYLRPQILYRQILKIRSIKNLIRFIRTAIKIVFIALQQGNFENNQ
ncbi:MAG TPA: radical SAM protein [Victivallales bacterium]|nr:radical SAM protein [Victivallales bacterium]HPO89535.1 radical SAM protein [Victivallales bacterium]